MACRSCSAEVALGEPVCGACGRLQPMDRREDPFSLLGLPRQFDLDGAALERAFHERSRRVHPDRFARAEPGERRLALERATRLNDAHRQLLDWRARAAWLLRLADQDPLAAPRDPEFLEEQLELREALARARAAGDAARLEELSRDGRRRLAALEAEVAARFREEGWYSEGAAELARRVARARFLDHLAAEAEGAWPAP